ncbi:acetyl-CoA-benzylalcohol acetyltransferase-like protein [Tanacetum coccineum]
MGSSQILHFIVRLMKDNHLITGLMMLVLEQHFISASGDHDMVTPHQLTQAWIKDLNYSVTDQWRSWRLNGQIVGYTESYSNLMTFATVKGGGHTPPQDKPEECFAMFKRQGCSSIFFLFHLVMVRSPNAFEEQLDVGKYDVYLTRIWNVKGPLDNYLRCVSPFNSWSPQFGSNMKSNASGKTLVDRFLIEAFLLEANSFCRLRGRLTLIKEQEDAVLNVQSSDPAPPRPNIFSWVKWVLASIVPLMFSFWKQKWDSNVEEVAREVEEVAEVVEKVASTTEKISAEVAEKLDNGELKQVALMVEHVSTIIAKDARMTEEFIHKVGDLKQDITDLENMVEHAIDKTKNYYKLSRLDQLALPSYINQVYYYKPSGDINILDTCGQLVKSLSEVLTLFYPLAGRITEEGLKVDCSDQGVKFIETKVTTRLDDFLNKGPKIDHVKQLIGISDQDTTTLVIVQLNVFDCGALVIGVSASHKVTDAYNLVRFINQWASTNRTGCISDAFCPTFDNLASLFQPRVISSMEQSHVTNEPLPKIVTKRYVFNGSIISKLKEKDGSDYGKHSRVTLVAALIWKALISVDQLKSGSLRNCILAPAINLRGKIGSRILDSSFGNVWIPYSIRFLQNEMEPKFVNLVRLIEDTTREIIMELPKASGEDICTQAMACYAEVGEELKQNKFSIFTSWCRFPIYEADFGWGKPYWASEAGRSHDMVTLVDDKHGDGVEAWVNLNEKDMHVFEKDEDILEITS